MTFSEFGRRIQANSGRGTDHGTAAPLIVFGTSVNPIIHGTNPVLPANAGVNDQVPRQFDFRAIYASLLKDWFKVPQATLNALLPSTTSPFPYVPVIRPAVVAGTASAANLSVAGFSVYPNPVRDRATVGFACEGGHVQVLLYDGLGREVARPLDRSLPRGVRKVSLDASGLAAGSYHCQVQEGQRISSQLIVVE